MQIILILILLLILIYFIDIFIRKEIWKGIIKKMSFNTAILLIILSILLVFIVFPKGYGYRTCFESTYKGNIIGKLKNFDFLYSYCKKELDSKGNYYFER